MNDPEYSMYEQQRIDNMKRNDEFLLSLGLTGAKAHTEPVVSRKRAANSQNQVQKLPTRRSGRVTVEKIKSDIADLLATGDNETANKKQIELDCLLQQDPVTNSIAIEDSMANSSYEMSSRFFDPVELCRPLDKALARNIINSVGSCTKSANADNHCKLTASYINETLHAILATSDIAKVTKQRVTAVTFLPTDHKILLAAGDKVGQVGLWCLDDHASSDNQDSDAVCTYRTHVSSVCRLHAAHCSPAALHSVSYDGTIRTLNSSNNSFECSFQAPESLDEMYVCDASFRAGDSTCACDDVLLGLSTGYLAQVDLRQSSTAYSWKHEVYESKVNSVQHHPSEEHLVIAVAGGTTGYISIFDLRMFRLQSSASAKKNKKVVEAIMTLSQHSKSINAAYASTDGSVLLSVSHDDTVRAWTDFCLPQSAVNSHKLAHNNNTGRWLSTFRPAFDPKHPTLCVLGSMSQPRGVDLLLPSAQSVGPVGTLRSENLASVCSRNCFHPYFNMIACGNSSGRVHVFPHTYVHINTAHNPATSKQWGSNLPHD